MQMMINTCQTWREKARMLLNADRIEVMCFHKTHKPTMNGNIEGKFGASNIGHHHSTSFQCSQTIPTPQTSLTHTLYFYPRSYRR